MIKDKYEKEISKNLQQKFAYKNVFSIPRLEKIVLNTGVGNIVSSSHGAANTATNEETAISDIVEDLTLISGQRPQIIRAGKSIAGFKLRKGSIAGLRVTLRGKRMYDFLERLITMAFPRTRDFRGLDEKSVDSHGNMTIGIREQIIFPEIPHDKVRKIWGMEITIVTTAKTKDEGVEFLRQLGIPFKNRK